MKRCLFDWKIGVISLLLSMGMSGTAWSASEENALCLNEAYRAAGNNQDTVCTAGDIKKEPPIRVTSITTPEGDEITECTSGEFFDAVLTITGVANSIGRYDVHTRVNQEGGSAWTDIGRTDGEAHCAVQSVDLTNPGTSGFSNVEEAPYGPGDGDICADLSSTATDVSAQLDPISIKCVGNEAGELVVSACFSWTQTNDSTTCSLVPDAPAKCTCRDIPVGEVKIKGEITVIKDADPADGTNFPFIIQDAGGTIDGGSFTLDDDNGTDGTYSDSTTVIVDLNYTEDKVFNISETIGSNWEGSYECVYGETALTGVYTPGTATDVTLNADQSSVTCKFYNKLQTADVTVVKVCKDVDGNEIDGCDGATFPVKLVCGEDDDMYDGEKSITATEAGKLVVSDVPVGTSCTATEPAATIPDDWELDGISPSPLTVSVDGDNTITVTNVYNPVRDVTVVKVCKDVDGNEIDGCDGAIFPAKLVCGEDDDMYDGEKSITATEAGKLVVSDVPVGTSCTATEPAATIPADWELDGISPSPLTVSVDGDNTITVTNVYNPVRDVTVVKVCKDVDGNEIDGCDGATFPVKLVCGEDDDMYDGEKSITATEAGKLVVPDVPVGTSCVATEPEATIPADWELADPDGISPDPLTVNVDETKNTITVTNIYNPLRPVTVEKKCVEDDGTTSRDCSGAFEVRLNCGSDINITLDGGNSYSHTTTETFAVGTACSVLETSMPPNWVDITNYPAGGTITLDGLTVTVTNKYDPPSLKLIKKVDGPDYPANTLVPGDCALSAGSLGSGNGMIDYGDVDEGTYALLENCGGLDDRYSGSWSCTAGILTDNSLALGTGDDAVCTITNTFEPICETAFAFGNKDFDDLFKRNKSWGWAYEMIREGEEVINKMVDIFAGQNELVGHLNINWDGEELVLTAEVNDPWIVQMLHLYTAEDKPKTPAPGQYDKKDGMINTWTEGPDGTFTTSMPYSENMLWLIWHAEVCY